MSFKTTEQKLTESDWSGAVVVILISGSLVVGFLVGLIF